MKRFELLKAVIFLLSSVLCLDVPAQDPGANFPPIGASAQAKIEFYRVEIQKCKDYLDELSIGINKAKILFQNDQANDPGPSSGEKWFKEFVKLNEEIRPICIRISLYQDEIYSNQKEKAKSPTPTPTPDPNNEFPIETESKKSGDGPTNKQVKEYEDQIKFINDYRNKLKEVKTEADKVFKDIDDYLKKTYPNQPVPIYKGTDASTDGLSTTTFSTPEGRIILNLPNDMQAGDTISGTVVIEPKGQTEEERKKNEVVLKKYGIGIVAPPPSGQFFTRGVTTVTTKSEPKFQKLTDDEIWQMLLTELKGIMTVPVELADRGLVTTLVTRNCKAVLTKNVGGQTYVPIEIVKLNLTSAQPIPVTSPKPPVNPNDQGTMRFPSLGQTGRLLEIKGIFDGSGSSTKVNIGGKPVEILAESPRNCIFRSPTNITGPTEITVNEGGRESKGTFRNIGIRLSAPKTNLIRGEKTTVTVEVTGLNGIRSNVPLQLEKTGTVTIQNGDTQHIQIQPQDVDSNGVFRLTRELTGVQPGGFNITGTVHDPTRRPVIIPLTEGAGTNGFHLVNSGGKSRLEAENVIDPLTGKPVEGTQKLQTACANPVSSFPLLNMLFKNGNAGREVNSCLILVTPKIIIRDEN